MKKLCPRDRCSLCQSQPLTEPARSVQKTGTGKRSGWVSLIKQTITLAWLRSSNSFYFPTKVAHVLRQCKPCYTPVHQSSIQLPLASKSGQKGNQGQTGRCDGESVLLPLAWSGRAFLNPHGFCQIDTNCPSKELRFILKRLKIQLLKLC